MVTQTESFAIATIAPTLDAYFQGFNSENYDAVASLFHAEGVLRPPFEEGIVGPEAILAYLQREAKGMKATPLEAEVTSQEEGQRQVVVQGKVKALVFMVNVRWTFILNEDDAIMDAHIKLLASLQELMQMNQGEKSQAGA
jgi:hypothetical protein